MRMNVHDSRCEHEGTGINIILLRQEELNLVAVLVLVH